MLIVRKPIGLEERGETENARFFLYPSMWLLVWLGNTVYTPLANTRGKLSQPNGQRPNSEGVGQSVLVIQRSRVHDPRKKQWRSRPSACKADALPFELHPQSVLKAVAGIRPFKSAFTRSWKEAQPRSKPWLTNYTPRIEQKKRLSGYGNHLGFRQPFFS